MTDHLPTVSRRVFLGGSLAALAVAAVGCSTEKTPGGSTSGEAGGGAATNDGIFTVNFFGPTEALYHNWNPFSPAENKGSGLGYFYEPLMRFNRFKQYEPSAWLAEKWAWNDAFDELTFNLRTDVKWSDGQPFTADDVVFTLMMPQEYAKSNLLMTDVGVASATKVDDHTVKVKMKEAGLVGLNNVGAVNIYPKHVLSDQDLDKWTNPEPIGTGPWKYSRFSPQQITVVPNPDYWGGPLTHLKECRWAVFGNADAGKALVTQGKIDMATMSWPDAQTTFVDKGPGNLYQVYPTGGGEALLYNCARAPLSDEKVRTAVTKAIDFAKVMSLYEIGLTVANVSGLAESVWGAAIAPDFKGKTIAADPEGAKQDLADGGWTVADGKLVKDGKSYQISLKTVAEYTNWATWSDGFKQQLKDNLGLDVAVLKLPGDQLSKQEQEGDFDIAMDFAGGGPLLSLFYANGYGSLRKQDVVPLGEVAAANVMRFSNDQVSTLLDQMASSTDNDEIVSLNQQVQALYVQLRPHVIYNAAGNFIELNGSKWAGVPKVEDNPDYAPVPYGQPDTTMMYQNLKPSGN